MARVGKVTCLITRASTHGPELCVFEHPRAGVQLPAGTLHRGEHPHDGARREAFEETGLEQLEFVDVIATRPAAPDGSAIVAAEIVLDGRCFGPGYLAEVIDLGRDQARVRVVDATGDVPRDALCFDAVRTFVHFTTEQPTPDEWWVITPDGDGLAWRCWWMPVAAAGLLHPAQQPWLDHTRPALLAGAHPPARPSPWADLIAAGATEFFFAPPFGGRAVIDWLEVDEAPPDDAIVRAECFATTAATATAATATGATGDTASPDTGDAANVVAVAATGHLLQFPGGRRERGESVIDTLCREVREEAAAEVLDYRLLGFQRFRHFELGLGPAVASTSVDAIFWARVRLLPFDAAYETTARHLVPLAEAASQAAWCHPVAQRLIARGRAAHASAGQPQR